MKAYPFVDGSGKRVESRAGLKPQSPQELAAALDGLRTRLDAVGKAVVDKNIQARLDSLRNHLSTAAIMLRNGTEANLRRVSERIDYTAKQLILLTTTPDAVRRGPYQR